MIAPRVRINILLCQSSKFVYKDISSIKIPFNRENSRQFRSTIKPFLSRKFGDLEPMKSSVLEIEARN